MREYCGFEEPGIRYMLQVRSWGRWRNWWTEPAALEEVEEAGGFDGIVASLQEAPRPVTGAVRLIRLGPDSPWAPGGVIAFRDKPGRR